MSVVVGASELYEKRMDEKMKGTLRHDFYIPIKMCIRDRSYAVTTVDGDGTEQDRRIMGMEAAHDWALHGPFLDKTLMRNYIAMNFSGEMCIRDRRNAIIKPSCHKDR